MSTGNKKVPKKPKRIIEKDKRMAQLEKEIARLENENSKLKRDSAGYENRLAALNGTPRFATVFPSMNRDLQLAGTKRVAQKTEVDSMGATQSRNYSDEGTTRKKKLRTRLMKVARKSDGKK